MTEVTVQLTKTITLPMFLTCHTTGHMDKYIAPDRHEIGARFCAAGAPYELVGYNPEGNKDNPFEITYVGPANEAQAHYDAKHKAAEEKD